MRIFLLWRHSGGLGKFLDPETVATNLQRVFAPLLKTALKRTILESPAITMVVFESPAHGWKPPFFQEDEQTWALAVDYPVNGRKVLAANGARFAEDNFLLALCRKLQETPRALLEELAPPCSLVWSSKQTGATFIQNDGLGQSQLFEFKDEHVWALSNKLFAFQALGVSLEPEPEQWAVWATLGWFPLEMSGYKKIRFLEAATQLRLDTHGIHRARHDVLSNWVHPPRLSRNDCLEMARCSLIEHINGCIPLWEKPSVGLSGGWDSRTVVSSLRAAGADFSARVRGLPGRYDVIIASELARIAGFKLRVQNSGGLPPENPEACRRSLSLALLWQGGHMTARRHKTFLASQQNLEVRAVSITGQHGEIGRRERALFDDQHTRNILSRELTEVEYEGFTLRALMADMPPFTNRSLQDFVRDTIAMAYQQADRYNLTGLARMDFFCLNEFTRRKGSAVHAWQTRLLLAPFLNPDFIRGVFGYADPTDTNVFHRYIIATNSADWVNVPYYEDLEAQRLARERSRSSAGLEQEVEMSPDWKQPKGRENYDGSRYWQEVGKPLIDEALVQGGFWTEVFDPDLAPHQWLHAPDQLAILYLLPNIITRTDTPSR